MVNPKHVLFQLEELPKKRSAGKKLWTGFIFAWSVFLSIAGGYTVGMWIAQYAGPKLYPVVDAVLGKEPKKAPVLEPTRSDGRVYSI